MANIKCQLCSKILATKDSFIDHLHRHLNYRRYPCKTCNKLFFTKPEREAHCEKHGHEHSFESLNTPYAEMMLDMLQKDSDVSKKYGIDAVIKQRMSANRAFDKNIQECHGESTASSPSKSCDHVREVLPNVMKGNRTIQKRAIVNTVTSPQLASPPDKIARTKTLSTSSNTSEKAAEQMEETPINIGPSKQPSTTRCNICRKSVVSDYISRKEHASKSHMGSDHTDEDYVQLLEEQMKKAFPFQTYKDTQCQSCEKEYLCITSRRKHVYENHLLSRICCPIKGCKELFTTAIILGKHLRAKHMVDLSFYKKQWSIENAEQASTFDRKLQQHNIDVKMQYEFCFPCSVPEGYNKQERINTAEQPETQVLSGFREIFCQKSPRRRPVHPQSESSESSESDEEMASNASSALLGVTSNIRKENEVQILNKEDADPLEFADIKNIEKIVLLEEKSDGNNASSALHEVTSNIHKENEVQILNKEDADPLEFADIKIIEKIVLLEEKSQPETDGNNVIRFSLPKPQEIEVKGESALTEDDRGGDPVVAEHTVTAFEKVQSSSKIGIALVSTPPVSSTGYMDINDCTHKQQTPQDHDLRGRYREWPPSLSDSVRKNQEMHNHKAWPSERYERRYESSDRSASRYSHASYRHYDQNLSSLDRNTPYGRKNDYYGRSGGCNANEGNRGSAYRSTTGDDRRNNRTYYRSYSPRSPSPRSFTRERRY